MEQGGSALARDLLYSRNPIGTVRVGGTNTSIKYAYERTTSDGRLVTVVTATPIAFVGRGLPGAPSSTGFDLGVVMLTVAASGSAWKWPMCPRGRPCPC